MTTNTLDHSQVFVLLRAESDYPVDFDVAWQWAGYSAKHKGLDKLKAHFQEGLDFSTVQLKTPEGGRPSCYYGLTNECFKMFCMMAGTEKGKAVRKYFIDCERELKSQAQATAVQPLPMHPLAARHQLAATMINHAASEGADAQTIAAITNAIVHTHIVDKAIKAKGKDASPSAPRVNPAARLFLDAGSGYVVLTGNKADYVPVAKVYVAYCKFVAESLAAGLDLGDNPELSKQMVGKSLQQVNPLFVSKLKRINGKVARVYHGLSLTLKAVS